MRNARSSTNRSRIQRRGITVEGTIRCHPGSRDVYLEDDSDRIRVLLREEDRKNVDDGTRVRITNGHTSVLRDEVRLGIPRNGTFEVLGE